MSDFKFAVGSFVRMKLSANQTNAPRWGEHHNETRGQVIGRWAEECPGGVQRHYTVRWVTASGSFPRELFQHNEIELVASEPFPANEGE